MSSLRVSLSIIQDGRAVKGREIFEIKAEQNHTFKSFFDLFLELEGIDTAVRNALFLLFSMQRKT